MVGIRQLLNFQNNISFENCNQHFNFSDQVFLETVVDRLIVMESDRKSESDWQKDASPF